MDKQTINLQLNESGGVWTWLMTIGEKEFRDWNSCVEADYRHWSLYEALSSVIRVLLRELLAMDKPCEIVVDFDEGYYQSHPVHGVAVNLKSLERLEALHNKRFEQVGDVS